MSSLCDRCVTVMCSSVPADGIHFFSTSESCEGQKTESLLGYLSTTRSSTSPRAMRRCRSPDGFYVHALDIECDAGMADEGLYGFVF